MTRRLVPVLTVLALAAPALASFTATHGHYRGPSTGGVDVTFHYAHGEIVGFQVGTVHACPEAWVGQDHSFTCHHSGKFVVGRWTSATEASGEYVYHRQTSRGSAQVTLRWTARHVAG